MIQGVSAGNLPGRKLASSEPVLWKQSPVVTLSLSGLHKFAFLLAVCVREQELIIVVAVVS